MKKLIKKCEQCNKVYKKPYTISFYVFSNRRFCTNKCRGIARSSELVKENHPRWNKKPTYIGIHGWLHWNYGKATQCDNREKQFLFFNCSEKSNNYQWANNHEKPYERDKNNFFMLCRSCHAKYDLFDKERVTELLIIKNRVQLVI